MKKLLNFLYNDMYCEVFCLLFLILSFCFDPIDVMLKGYVNILTSQSILSTDYIFIGGLSATFLNVFVIFTFNMVLIRLLKQKVSGPIFCGLLMIAGFSFFWKKYFKHTTYLFRDLVIF